MRLPRRLELDRIVSVNQLLEEKTMITADEARKIADSKVKSEHSSPLFKYAIDLIERYVRDASSRGCRSFSLNVDTLGPGYNRPALLLRKAIAEELRKNGFSYNEIWKDIGCVWFEVSW